ncbi:uncharacterized protein [Cicer arietinum]|uniref:Uncharacterized protein At4g04775-like isoform X2 n=1 Tax=Cicer arietinum TaxID=3827 RepID=A0A1S2Y0U9_CICAR|nr:uncharacterized protein At4g04775-like isoform X2 [Cicer arietinum]
MKSVVRSNISPLISKHDVNRSESVLSVDTLGNVDAPTCKCGKKCVLYISKTSKNLNIPFFRCPYFKQNRPHCNFFMPKDKFIESQITMVELLEAKINQMERDVEVMKIEIENDMETKINRLERDMEVKISQFEREIELMKIQMIEMQVKMEEATNWKRYVRMVGVVIVVWLYPFVFGSKKRLFK